MREQSMFDPARLVFIDETNVGARAHPPTLLARE
jgi:hypothetical protein